MRNPPCGSGSAYLAALLVAGLLGCTSGAQSTTVVPGTTVALATQLATAFCAAQLKGGCGVSSDASAPDGSFTDTSVPDGGASTCLERAKLSANQQLALVSTAFSEGLLTISPAIATTCVAAYAGSNCATRAGQSAPDVQAALDDPACANLFTGYIPVGERCDMTAECVAGSYCLSQGTGQNASAIAGSGTLGVCFGFQGMGGACDTTQDCLPPLTCNATTLVCE